MQLASISPSWWWLALDAQIKPRIRICKARDQTVDYSDSVSYYLVSFGVSNLNHFHYIFNFHSSKHTEYTMLYSATT